MSEMVERVAKAICLAHGYQSTDDTIQMISMGKEIWTVFIPEARAAIEAMREPTEAMVAAVRRAKPHDMDITESWPIAIDAALK